MFNQRKNKRFNYQARFSSTEEQKKVNLEEELKFSFKRQPKQSNVKRSTLIMLFGLLIMVAIVMYVLETKM